MAVVELARPGVSIADQRVASGTARDRGNETVHPSMAKAHAAFHVPSAFVCDDVVYLTGVIAACAASPEHPDDRAEAFRKAFVQIAEVLGASGASWDDVVKLTSFHRDIGADIGIMASVKDEFCRKPYPAWSVIGASSLANPAGICEIEVIAHRPKR